jgi:hypothetical protein
MITAMFVEMLENLEYSTWLTFKSKSYALNSRNKNLMERIRTLLKSWTITLYLTLKIPAFIFMAKNKEYSPYRHVMAKEISLK